MGVRQDDSRGHQDDTGDGGVGTAFESGTVYHEEGGREVVDCEICVFEYEAPGSGWGAEELSWMSWIGCSCEWVLYYDSLVVLVVVREIEAQTKATKGKFIQFNAMKDRYLCNT